MKSDNTLAFPLWAGEQYDKDWGIWRCKFREYHGRGRGNELVLWLSRSFLLAEGIEIDETDIRQ